MDAPVVPVGPVLDPALPFGPAPELSDVQDDAFSQ